MKRTTQQKLTGQHMCPYDDQEQKVKDERSKQLLTDVFKLEFLKFFAGLFFPSLGKLAVHPKLERHHLHLLIVVAMVLPQVIQESHP